MITDDKRATMAHITYLKMLEIFPEHALTIESRARMIASAVADTDRLIKELNPYGK